MQLSSALSVIDGRKSLTELTSLCATWVVRVRYDLDSGLDFYILSERPRFVRDQ